MAEVLHLPRMPARASSTGIVGRILLSCEPVLAGRAILGILSLVSSVAPNVVAAQWGWDGLYRAHGLGSLKGSAKHLS
jgi:hypothetical protein